jgi:hypothetical protein
VAVHDVHVQHTSAPLNRRVHLIGKMSKISRENRGRQFNQTEEVLGTGSEQILSREPQPTAALSLLFKGLKPFPL